MRTLLSAIVSASLALISTNTDDNAIFVSAHKPIAPHQLYVVDSGATKELTLRGYDLDGDDLDARIVTLPQTGSLYQLSKIYSDYGYEPIYGTPISSTNIKVTGSQNRLLYKRPIADSVKYDKWSRMKYTVNDGNTDSNWGYITFVPPSGLLVGSDFRTGADSWTVSGNKAPISSVKYDSSSRGLMNQYIFAADDLVNRDAPNDIVGNDFSLWYFNAPGKFLGHNGIAYGGKLEFTLSSFSGDFSSSNLNTDTNLVVIECNQCKVNSKVTIAFPLKSAGGFTGGSGKKFSISLKETSGWLIDPENTLTAWSAPTKCEFIEVLSGMSSLKILGDFTRVHESVALDNVGLINTKAQIPICAHGSSDASICTC